jgi:hypothetical protein
MNQQGDDCTQPFQAMCHHQPHAENTDCLDLVDLVVGVPMPLLVVENSKQTQTTS